MLVNGQTPSAMKELPAVDGVSVQPWEEHEVVYVAWKGKEKSEVWDSSVTLAHSESPSEASIDDWTKYEPPQDLRHTEDLESELILQIIQQSIDRVKARIQEEGEQKAAAREAKRLQSVVNNEGYRDENQPVDVVNSSLPVKDSAPTDHSSRSSILSQDVATGTGSTGGVFPSELPKRPRKRTLMNLLRKFNTSSPEDGESSAVGAARHRLLLCGLPWTELATHSARKRFVLDLIKKGTGEDPSTGSWLTSLGESEVECVSCLEDFHPKDTVRAPCHNYCTPCFRRLVASACRNEQHWPPKCCLNPIPDSTILIGLDRLQRIEYRKRAKEWNIPMAERVYCGHAGCGLFVLPEYIILAQGVARCTASHYTCLECRGPRHEGEDCPQERDLVRTSELAASEGWRRCPGCRVYIEHREACQHMTCHCGAEFCYVCGARWRSCECTMSHLLRVKQEAEIRRQARLEEEAREDAAAQEAIRLVAEFEREEALKAELLRQEQARAAEERRAKELEARIIREEERRRAIVIRFEDLTAAFQTLHETQHALIAEHHSRREQACKNDAEAALQRLLETHKLKREAQNARAEARINKKEETFKAECVTRVTNERQIKEQYAAKLKAFWGARGEVGETKAREAMDSLESQMDVGFAAWKKWVYRELDVYRHQVREEQAIATELMSEAERRLRERIREEAEVTVPKQIAAELRWVAEVIAERERMLEARKIEEIENGVDVDIDVWFAEDSLPPQQEEDEGEGEGEVEEEVVFHRASSVMVEDAR